jgi:dGTPase
MYTEAASRYPSVREKLKFSEANRRALDWLATGLIRCTQANIESADAHSVDDVRRAAGRLATFSAEAAEHNRNWKKFLHDRLYQHPAIVEERERSVAALEALFRHYVAHPETMPAHYSEQARTEPSHRVACDYIAGMTDQFLLRQHQEHVA